MVGVYYRLRNQGEEVNEAFLLQLQEASCSQALILLGSFNHPDICCKSSRASCKQFRRLLECIENNFLIQATGSPARGEALLDLLLTNIIKLTRVVNTGGRLGCSDPPWWNSVLRGIGQVQSRVRTLNSRRAKLSVV